MWAGGINVELRILNLQCRDHEPPYRGEAMVCHLEHFQESQCYTRDY